MDFPYRQVVAMVGLPQQNVKAITVLETDKLALNHSLQLSVPGA